MKRWMLNTVVALSLLLLLGTASAWVGLIPGRIGLAVTPTNHIQLAGMAVDRNLVLRVSSIPWPICAAFLEVQRRNLSVGRDPLDQSDVGESASNGRPTSSRSWELAGFFVARREYPFTSRSAGGAPYLSIDRVISVPYWLLTILLAMIPAWWFVVIRQRRVCLHRLQNGQCTKCGYDLRATPDRCPECGAESGTSNPHIAKNVE